ncbi:hypothetical protein F5Y16DRAFT_164022 [Xylariaceae sp. FL0255]|nr:hypothetical protein F5Y16DRAFT_164022 [Xylariaceae sp. FL0255]
MKNPRDLFPWRRNDRNLNLPPTLNPNGQNAHEIQASTEIASVRSKRNKEITPYLGLRSRLSQIWMNRWTILILLVLAQFLLTIGSLNNNLEKARTQALSACTKVEDVGSAFASMPHYLSVGVNQLTATGINNAISALTTILNLILTVVEELIIFVIGMYTNTYACLISMVIHGGLNISATAIEAVTNGFNEAIQNVTSDVESEANSLQAVIDTVYGDISSLGSDLKSGASSVLGGLHLRDIPTKPEINQTIDGIMDNLKNVQINTTGIVGGLDNLNNNIPTFEDVQNLTQTAISVPFDWIKSEINKTWGSYQFNDSVFPVAEKQSLSFCSDNDTLTNFFEDLFKLAYYAKIAAIVILIILAILSCVPMWIIEKRRWKRQNASVENAVDYLDYGYIYTSPLRARVGLFVANKLGNDKHKKIMARWVVSYATSIPALFVLALALAGYFSCFWQAILLRAIQKEVPIINQEVGNFANEVVGALTNVSQQYADDANGVINSWSNEINGDILGKVVNATTTVNNTLNTFMDDINKGITDVFGDTVFADLADALVHCLLGLKIDSVEKGLTWVHDNAHVNFPEFPSNIFSVGANESISSDSTLTSFLSSPSSVTSDEITGAVDDVVNWLHNQIIQQALISTGLLLAYVIAVLLGVMRAMYVVMTPGKHNLSNLDQYPPGDPASNRSFEEKSHPRNFATDHPPSDPFDDHNSIELVEPNEKEGAVNMKTVHSRIPRVSTPNFPNSQHGTAS